MWTKRAPILLVRLGLRGVSKLRLWFFLPLALYVPQHLLLAWEGALSLLPGQPGAWARRAVDTLHRILVELMAASPQSIVDADLAKGRRHVRVKICTWGIFGGGDEA